jgi:hypothetical protein
MIFKNISAACPNNRVNHINTKVDKGSKILIAGAGDKFLNYQRTMPWKMSEVQVWFRHS